MSDSGTTCCPIANDCGGCSQVDVAYEQQLAAKQERIASLFEGLAGEGCVLEPIAGMQDPWGYRNKIVSPVALAKSGPSKRSLMRTGRSGMIAARRSQILTGMYKAGTHELVACESCPVEHPVGRRVVAAVRQVMARYGMQPYDEDAGTGFVRHVVVRVGHASGEVLVTIVTNGSEFQGAKNFCREVVKQVPEVTTIVQNVNTHQTNAILGTEEHVLYGPGFILDTLCGLSFRISSRSFYQVNAVQTEVLYRIAISLCQGAGVGAPDQDRTAEQAGSQANNRAPLIVDAYCGTGTIGLVAAADAPGARVVGVDKVESAIRDARQNARHNGIANAEFVAADAGEYLQQLAAQGTRPDVLFLDPPRAGASEQFLHATLAAKPARIVYISCNPETQVRDASILLEGGYALRAIQPVDMFPHTPHVECVALMSRTDG